MASYAIPEIVAGLMAAAIVVRRPTMANLKELFGAELAKESFALAAIIWGTLGLVALAIFVIRAI